MLDNPEKTARLLAALKAAVPFEVDLTPAVVTSIRICCQRRPDTPHRLGLIVCRRRRWDRVPHRPAG